MDQVFPKAGAQLLGADGRPISSETQSHKKAAQPATGPAFGQWSGRDVSLYTMPGGGVLTFDLSALTLADYRAMRHHPQINASLSVLTFMIHQVDWHIECEDQDIADFVESNMRDIWTRLVRAMSQAFWSGYSPSALEYENDVQNRKIRISKVKDLIPESCSVNWKEVKGALPRNAPAGAIPEKHYIYDGIKQFGSAYPIPPENTLWYPVLMENGDYYGRNLLKAAFMPWYFSILIHLFANRYFERFGEPIIYGRAPFDEEVIMPDGSSKSGKELMEDILVNLRNRSVITLPSDRDPAVTSAGANKAYIYEVDYLESQMRGADFERYMERLDEEMSLALFTPLLLMRTAGEGSHNLGVQHTQTWLWSLNAITGDMKEYIDRYICERLKAINYTPNAPKCEWVPHPMGKHSTETLRAVITELIRQNKVAPADLDELGTALGLSLKEIKEVTEEPATDSADDDSGDSDVDDRQRTERDRSRSGPRGVGEPRATGTEIAARIKGQSEKAFRQGRFGPDFKPTMGYRRRFEQSLISEGFTEEEAAERTAKFYSAMDKWLEIAVSLGSDEYTGHADFISMFQRRLDSEIESLKS